MLRGLYNILRSRLPHKKEICLHSWQTIDYHDDFDIHGSNEYYEIGCYKCNTTKKIDKYAYKTMKKEGMLI